MKILHVISSLSIRSGGPAKFCLDLAFKQVEMDHQVTICTSNRENPWHIKMDVNCNESLYLNRVRIIYFSAFSPLLISYSMIKWFIKNLNEFDIVHIHGIYRFPSTMSAFISRKKKTPFIIRPHGSLDPYLYNQSKYNLYLKRIYEKMIELPNLNNATIIHYTSSDEVELASFLKIKAPAIVIPNGIDWKYYDKLPEKGNFRRRYNLNSRTPLILFLGRINFKKGLDLLIPAFARIVKKNDKVNLVIVGPDNDGYLRKVIKDVYNWQIEKHTLFVDYIPNNLVKEAFVDSDLFVLPSYSENFGIAVIEALACKCPVLISNKVNIWKEIIDAGAGAAVELNINSLAEKMEEMINNTNLLNIMGEKGRMLAKEKYSLDVIAKLIDSVYEKIQRGNNIN